MMLDVDVQELVDNHVDLMKIVDKLKVIKLLKKAIENQWLFSFLYIHILN